MSLKNSSRPMLQLYTHSSIPYLERRIQPAPISPTSLILTTFVVVAGLFYPGLFMQRNNSLLAIRCVRRQTQRSPS